MLAQTRLIERLSHLLQPEVTGFVRLREPLDITSFTGWLKGQTLYPRIYWHARERDREFATLGILREIRDEEQLAQLSAQPKPMAGSWPRYYGGLSFDSQADLATAPHWQAFGHCRFILPRIELIRQGNQTELVCNLWLEADPLQRQRELTSAQEALLAIAPEQPLAPLPALTFTRQESPDSELWSRLVSQLTDHTHLSQLPKVVLARESRLATANTPNPWDLLAALQPLTPACFHFAFQFSAESCFLASSPERLYRRHGQDLESEALAGTMIRTGDSAADEALAQQLLADNKNRLENRLVHADILTRLEGLAEQATLSSARILRLRRLQHLRRDITARLKPGVSDAQLLATLHPTPAVGGTPRRKALTFIREHEPFARGWYAGACGLISEDVAEFAVAIRSLLLTPGELRLYAGAGIVAGSEPAAEWQELDDKLANLLGLLTQGSTP
ncbi:MAG: isochorismate synthase [Aeromonadaceae bacterium]